MTDEVAQLRRRVQRERAARLAAEQIAETALRDLYTRQRSLQLLSDIAVLANTAANEREAYAGAAKLLRTHLGWEVVHVWRLLDAQLGPPTVP